MDYRDILFEVWTGPAAETRYRIYANGEVEGFGDDARVINCYHSLLTRELRRYSAANGIAFKSPAEKTSTSPREGAGHSANANLASIEPEISAALGEK
jgi:hypothetical protein